MIQKVIHIIGGGTNAHIANHLSLSAPAQGTTARFLFNELYEQGISHKHEMKVKMHLTKMAGGVKELDTNQDVANWVKEIKTDLATKIVFFNVALVDYEPYQAFLEGENGIAPILEFGKYTRRINTRDFKDLMVKFKPSEKIISTIRHGRKDIFLVGFKTTCGASKQEMFEKGLNLCKTGSVNLVLVNDTKTHWNMIVTPEEASYHETDNRKEVLKNLIEMTLLRSHLTFTQSTVVDGKAVPWTDPRVPESLRKVVDYCVGSDAYKPFLGSTVGHFAVKVSDTEFLTSIRRSNFNDLHKTGLVYVKTDGPDSVIAYGAKPSVGGQSQRIVFNDHKGMDCIVHFHSPLKDKPRDAVPIRSQREYECGSHQCGKNTSDGLKRFGNLKAVYLEQHGPNIVFSKDTDPDEVIDFIKANFDLHEKTGGYNLKLDKKQS